MTRRGTSEVMAWLFVLAVGCANDSGSKRASEDGGTVRGTGALGGGGGPGAAGGDGATSGSGGASGSAGAVEPSYPDGTQEAIGAFVEAERYRDPPFTPETDTPREELNAVSPHDRVQVWFNDVALASHEEGNGASIDAPAHTTGTMAVKEFYDATDALVGRAAILKLEGDRNQAAYYCDGPPGRCGVSDVPFFSTGLSSECSFCHGGILFSLNSPSDGGL